MYYINYANIWLYNFKSNLKVKRCFCRLLTIVEYVSCYMRTISYIFMKKKMNRIEENSTRGSDIRSYSVLMELNDLSSSIFI